VRTVHTVIFYHMHVAGWVCSAQYKVPGNALSYQLNRITVGGIGTSSSKQIETTNSTPNKRVFNLFLFIVHTTREDIDGDPKFIISYI